MGQVFFSGYAFKIKKELFLTDLLFWGQPTGIQIIYFTARAPRVLKLFCMTGSHTTHREWNISQNPIPQFHPCYRDAIYT